MRNLESKKYHIFCVTIFSIDHNVSVVPISGFKIYITHDFVPCYILHSSTLRGSLLSYLRKTGWTLWQTRISGKANGAASPFWQQHMGANMVNIWLRHTLFHTYRIPEIQTCIHSTSIQTNLQAFRITDLQTSRKTNFHT